MTDAQLKEVFDDFANFGAGSGKQKTDLESKNFKKMLEDSKLLNKGKLTPAEMDMIFTKCKKPRNMPFAEFKAKALPDLAKAVHNSTESAAIQKIREEIVKSGPKNNTSVTMSKTGGVDRMTDTKNYTGSHKERFDESGKGKGAAGREDKVSCDGYVQGYKSQGSYKK